MNYKESIDWLYSFEKFGIKLGLDRIKYICKKLGNPQNNYKIIHVGGTNGKGSVCRFLQSVLTINGYKTGVYLSPHLQRFSERFLIDGDEISKKDVLSLIKKVKPIIDKMTKNEEIPTFFEIVTAIAFQYFSDKKVAVFISSIYAGENKHYDHAYQKYLVDVVDEHPNLNPVSIAAFGGRIPKKEIPNIAPGRLLIRLPEHQYDNRDWNKVENWAHELGKLFE